jgi:hypothetical protein
VQSTLKRLKIVFIKILNLFFDIVYYTDFVPLLPLKRFKPMNQTELKAKAYKYYCKGLNSKEIAKLLNISFRTVQNWIYRSNWKAKRNAK